MKTKTHYFLGKLAGSSLLKASIMAAAAVLLLALLMNLATNVAFSNNGLTIYKKSVFLNTGNENCSLLLDEVSFRKRHDEIARKYFEETKVDLSLELLNNYCLSSSQVAELMKLFSYDRTRMDFAEQAIGKVMDPENFSVCKASFMIRGNEIVIDDLIKLHQAANNK